MKKFIITYKAKQSGVVHSVHISTVTAENEKKAKSLFARQIVEQEYGDVVKDTSIRRELARRVIEKCKATLSKIQIELHEPILN